jgi:hypothetical protein
VSKKLPMLSGDLVPGQSHFDTDPG